jgi:hypothetical protein
MNDDVASVERSLPHRVHCASALPTPVVDYGALVLAPGARSDRQATARSRSALTGGTATSRPAGEEQAPLPASWGTGRRGGRWHDGRRCSLVRPAKVAGPNLAA